MDQEIKDDQVVDPKDPLTNPEIERLKKLFDNKYII